MSREAQARAVAGWVRNLADGRVEAVVEGEPEALEGLLAWCRQGPGGARVAAVASQEEALEGLRGFRII